MEIHPFGNNGIEPFSMTKSYSGCGCKVHDMTYSGARGPRVIVDLFRNYLQGPSRSKLRFNVVVKTSVC